MSSQDMDRRHGALESSQVLSEVQSASLQRRQGTGNAWWGEAVCIYEPLQDRKRLVTLKEELVSTVTQTQLLLRVLDKPPEVPWFLVSAWEMLGLGDTSQVPTDTEPPVYPRCCTVYRH